MVEQNQDEQLIDEIGQHLKRERKLKNSFVMQFLNEQVLFSESFDLSKNPKLLARELTYLFPQWKDLLIKFEYSNRRVVERNVLENLTLKDVASIAAEHSDIWSKVADITKEAAELEKKGYNPSNQ